VPGLLALNQMKAMFFEKGGCDPCLPANSTGRAAAFQEDGCDLLAFCQKEGLLCPLDKLPAHVDAVSGSYRCFSREDIFAIAMNEFCC